ncbi:bifunctional phosphatase PAP2/diacylglycerol kinase family protein [Antrihabitans spumae]
MKHSASTLLDSLDRRLLARSAHIRPTGVDRSLLIASKLANHSVLWMGVAAGLAATGGTNRRAAVRGALAVAGASALANGVAKPVFPRRRPPPDSVPFVRRLVRRPESSSFPSGHAATAAAFATAVAIESPKAGLVVAPVAAAVAYSRVHIGVHWPSDVVVGAALGVGVALATRRWWAVRIEEPASIGGSVEVAALPQGRGLVVLLNAGAGSDDDSLTTELRERLPAATFVELDTERDIIEQIHAGIDSTDAEALGIVGGDGSVLAAAGIAIERGLPLAVFPGGTLNHFARDVGVTDVAATTEAAEALEAGSAVLIDIAEVHVDGHTAELFLNTSSLGGYPDSVRLREKWAPRFGKWPAAAMAMVRVLASAQPLYARIDGTEHAIWMLFVGNGRYSPVDKVPMSRPDLHKGALDVRYIRADTRLSRLRLVVDALAGTLGNSKVYVQQFVSKIDIEIDGAEVALATDGEVPRAGRTFRFASRPGALRVYRTP